MVVDSYLEMFTTVYGWLVYNIIWDVFAATGILFLPFLGMILDNVINAYQQGNTDSGTADYSLRSLEVDVVVAFFCVMIAGSPALTMLAEDVQYAPPPTLDQQPQAITNARDTQSTTYGAIAFTNLPISVEVPLWWYAVLQMSKGLTHAVREGASPLQSLNYREYMSQISLIDIEDQTLKREVNDFYRDCYVRAHSKYLNDRDHFSSSQQQAINSLFATYGQDDISYIGSRVLLQIPGYYDTLRARETVEGFLFNPIRDVEWNTLTEPASQWGKPYCVEWWAGSVLPTNTQDIGLKQRLIQEMSYWDRLISIFDGQADRTIEDDVLIKKLLAVRNDVGVWVPRDYDFAYHNDSAILYDSVNWAQRQFNDIAGIFSLAFLTFIFSAILDVYLKASHMIQAFLLMLIYGLLPFAIVVSRYRIGILMSGALIIFSIHFWTALWTWAQFLDQALIQAMFPEAGLKTLSNIWFNSQKTMILNFLAGMTYFILPLVLSMMFALAGFTAGRLVDAMMTDYKMHLSGAASRTSATGLGMGYRYGKSKIQEKLKEVKEDGEK